MRRVLVSSLLAGALLTAAAQPTLAAKPARQACVGESTSAVARAAGGDFGSAVAGLATTNNGVGEIVQAHLAGELPDEVFPNTCND